MVPWVGLQCVNVVVPYRIHLLFEIGVYQDTIKTLYVYLCLPVHHQITSL